jgi:hypothetical protein
VARSFFTQERSLVLSLAGSWVTHADSVKKIAIGSVWSQRKKPCLGCLADDTAVTSFSRAHSGLAKHLGATDAKQILISSSSTMPALFYDTFELLASKPYRMRLLHLCSFEGCHHGSGRRSRWLSEDDVSLMLPPAGAALSPREVSRLAAKSSNRANCHGHWV